MDKADERSTWVGTYDWDFVAITETWLREDRTDTLMFQERWR